MSLDTKNGGAGGSALVLEQRVLDLPRDALNHDGTDTASLHSLDTPLPRRSKAETAAFQH